MALDEPNADDKVFDQGEYRIVLDKQTADLAQQGGGLTIDFVDEAYLNGYLLRLNAAGESCDPDAGHGGGCSSCG